MWGPCLIHIDLQYIKLYVPASSVSTNENIANTSHLNLSTSAVVTQWTENILVRTNNLTRGFNSSNSASYMEHEPNVR